MAQEEYPLLPANVPDPAPQPTDLPPASVDPDVTAQIHLLATTALPPGTRPTPPLRPSIPPLRVVPVEPPAKRSRVRGCLTVGLVGLLILSLLASSAASLFWFWEMRAERVAEVAALATGAAPRDQMADRSSESGAAESNAAALIPAPQFTDPVNRIVIINERAAIETMAPDGSERRVLTEDGNAYQFPAWSPDGRSIAAIGGSMLGGGIYRIEDEDEPGEPAEVFNSRGQAPFYLYWAPDGQQIGFLASSRSNGMELNVVPSAGGDSRVLALGSPMYWNWTADSRQMLIHSGESGADSRMALINDQGQVQEPRLSSPGYFQAPGISASGRYWAYSQVRGGDTNWLITDDRVQDVQEGYRHAGSVALSWSPTRDEVAFISGDPDSQFSTWGPLRLLDPASGETRMLSTDTVLAFFWSPDGEKIATISLPAAPLLGEQFEVRGDDGRQFVRYGAAPQPVQRPGHTFRISVIDVRSGAGQSLTEQTLAPLFLAQFLPYFDQYALSHNIWSPASDALVLPVVEDRERQIVVLDTEDGRMETLGEGQAAFWTRQ